MKKLIVFVFAISLVFQGETLAAEKKFRRALILGGGGISPGVSLGVIAGLKKKGWEPDLIIATCGGALSAIVYDSYKDDKSSLKYAKSQHFKSVTEQATVKIKNILKIRKNFKEAEDYYLVPPIFSKGVMHIPQRLSKFLPEKSLGANEKTKVIILSARSHYGPDAEGWPRPKGKSFSQVFFTDPETATLLEGYKSPIAKLFPKGYVEEQTFTITDATPEQAARGSIADPFLMNPGKIGDDYYFTGAVDLFPLELAHELADEVVSNYPSGLYTDYEDVAIKSAFGFRQTDSVLHDIQSEGTKWIDLFGVEDHKFDPVRKFIVLKSGIPKKLDDFQQGIQEQWDFGYRRAVEAMDAQKDGPSKKHLRNPLEKYIKR